MHRDKERLIIETFKALMIAAVVIIVLPDMALAQAAGGPANGGADLGTAATDIMTRDVGPLAPLISALFWVAGGVLMGAGALKLKEHAENPTQTPMRQGISRLAVGAALLTIPFFSQFVVNTLSAGTTAVGYTAFTAPGGGGAAAAAGP